MICPSCKNDIADGLKFCPRCGARQQEAPRPGGVPSPPPSGGIPQPPAQKPGTPGPDAGAPSQQQRTIQKIQRDSSHDLTPAAPREEPVLDPEKRKNNIVIYAVAGAIALAIVIAAAFLLKPILFPPEPPKPSSAPPKIEPAPPPKKPKDISQLDTGGTKRLDEAALNEVQLAVASRMNEYFDEEKKQGYVRVYEMMTPKMRKWIAAYFTGQSADSAASYFDVRKNGDDEPVLTSAQLIGDIYLRGPRAEATAEVTGTLGGKEVKWRYVYVLVLKDDIWRIDGISGGPQGPVRATASADLDGDSEAETIVFQGDLLHHKLRWEVVEPDGRQSYVFEQSAFSECDPGDDDATYKTFMTATEKHPEMRDMTQADELNFKSAFPQWATARGIADAALEKRKGFILSDACGGVKYFVLYVNGLNYVEIPLQSGQ